VHSDFAAARLFLERAFVALRGDDEFSVKAREALALLIGACACKEAQGSPDVPAGASHGIVQLGRNPMSPTSK
jgi:hypothetical protein